MSHCAGVDAYRFTGEFTAILTPKAGVRHRVAMEFVRAVRSS